MSQSLASPNSDVLKLDAFRPQHQPPQILLLGLTASLALHGGVLLGLRYLWTQIRLNEVTDVTAVEMVDLGAIESNSPTQQPTQVATQSQSSQSSQPSQPFQSSTSPLAQAAPGQPAVPTIVAPEPVQPLQSPPQPSLPAQPQLRPLVTASPAPGRDRPTQPVQASPSAAASPTASSPPQPAPLPVPNASPQPGVGQPSPDATVPGNGSSGDGGAVGSGQPLPPTSASVRSTLGELALTSASRGELGAPATLRAKEPTLPPQQLPFPLVAGQILVVRVSFVVDNRTGALVRLQDPSGAQASPKVLPDSPAIKQGLIAQDNLQSLVTRLLESYQFEVKTESLAVVPAPWSEWVTTLEITAL